MIRLQGAHIYDPANGIHGSVGDIWIDGDRIVSAPDDQPPLEHVTQVDCSGMILAPAGVEIHTHVAGYGLNTARTFLMRDPEAQHLLLPSPAEAARQYLMLGYTTIFDAASSPLFAKATHADLRKMAGIDCGTYALMGDHQLLLQALARGNQHEIRDVLAWLLGVSGGYAVKLVNPGGGLGWKAHQQALGLDEPNIINGLTQREIILRITRAANSLGLPHPVHLHANHLGQPGNWTHFCQTAEVLEGLRAHLCHIQFYAYGKDGRGAFTSAAEQVVNRIAPLENLTFDAGQVVFGKALAITADTSGLGRLHEFTNSPWISRQAEGEGGTSAMPLAYLTSDPASMVQWAAGLELMLRFPDPGRMFLTCDHPNGGPFLAYPQIIEWLMSQPARQAVLDRCHPAGREKTGLGSIQRELSLSDIITMTSSGPAKALGLADRGHLAPGALADIRCYRRQADLQAMFARPAWVMRRGVRVVENGEILTPQPGSMLAVQPAWDVERLPRIYASLEELVSVRPENYGLGEAYLRPGQQEAL